jgi:SAM-dependent methyltransferase
MRDPKERFTDRVDDYVAHRPDYPAGVRELLARECGLGPRSVVVDLGSGTGILSARLLESGARVVGVEPNAAMRAAAERTFAREPRFESVAGSAEATGLGDASADLATAGQAFHWFDASRTRLELLRVLRRPAWVALMWNVRKDTPLGLDYEEMLVTLAPDYPAVRARDRAAEGTLRSFFSPSEPRAVHFDHAQRFDLAGLRGRVMSSSYAPKQGQPTHDAMMKRIEDIFAEHTRDGRVELAYDTVVWLGVLAR